MKKTYYAAAVLSAAALMTMGTAFAAMAEETTGWSYEGDDWVYLDSSGDKVTDSWKKSGDNWYYLDSDGILAKDIWVDDTYYVNEDGVMLINQWIYSDEDESPSGEEGWFYLGTNGKVVTDSWKQINNEYYYFDDDGCMCTGWHYDDDDDNSVYYLGDENDGSRKLGWLCLEYDEDDEPEERDVSEAASAGEGAEWFYFQSNGKMVKADSDYTSKTINGSKYYFDINGIMLNGWVAVASPDSADSTGVSKFKYFGDENDGVMAKGWKYLSDHPSDSDDSSEITEGTNAPEEGDSYWYYFDSDGTPKYLSDDTSTITASTARINSNSYFFDEYGSMQYGLIGFTFGDTTYAVYFGDTDDDGEMKTGKQSSVYDGDDEKGTYYFNTSGSYKGGGYTGEKDGYLYYEGKLVEAEEDSDYQVFCITIDGTEHFYLVNESGKVQTSNKNYKVDSEYKYQYSSGTIYLIDSDGENPAEVTADDCTALPSLSFDEEYTLE